ncbi:MAG: 2-phospho-L-lactate transferase [Thermoleophilaceae bacterium]|nr:2-phospho-L-lactate transferase [Thermoleophilaceae bacterium]
MVVVLAGGTGGAKLAAGLHDLLGPDELTVIANTGDDVELYGVHVSPDPDLVTYWLAGIIDERGWGIEGDSWRVMGALEAVGRPAWFRLGDRDLAMCLVRTQELNAGRRLTEAHGEVVRALGVQARVLPMSDAPVRTKVRTPTGWRPFQEFMILDRAAAPIEEVKLDGVESASPPPEALEAIDRADAILIGPSNPIISIGPILAVPGMAGALAAAPAPVVAVSPFVGGRAVKGPTDAFMEHAGLERSASGIAAAYREVAGGLVADEPAEGVPVLVTDTLMDGAEGRRRVAQAALDHCASLTR